MDTTQIVYRLSRPDGSTMEYVLSLEPAKIKACDADDSTLPPWTKLEYKQCTHCPLSQRKNTYCPLAAKMSGIMGFFDSVLSYARVRLEIETTERMVVKETTSGRALSSIMGLVIPTSGCPHTAYFRPMARFHLPFASPDETVYRAASMYLLAQYYCHQAGFKPDMDMRGLKKIYENMRILNASFAERLRAASKTDTSINAIALLDTFTFFLPVALDESLKDFRTLFEAYLGK
jgi:hypothetical protein